MNSDELLTALREQRTKVPMTVSVEQVISRGRAVRARRRIPGLATALGAAAAAAIAVTALLPGHQASHRQGIQLAAWTVVKHADGTVYVRIRQLRDPIGLQRMLRADGVPASVSFGDEPYAQPGLCLLYANQQPLGKVLEESGRPAPVPQVSKASTVPVRLRGNEIALTIDPSALPANAGIRIRIFILKEGAQVGVRLVMASQRCTGS